MSLMRDYLRIPKCNLEVSVTLGALRPNVGGRWSAGEGRRAKGLQRHPVKTYYTTHTDKKNNYNFLNDSMP